MSVHVMIGTPCYGGAVTTGYMLSVMQLGTYFQPRGTAFSLCLLGGDSLITRARTQVTAQFLDNKAATHLLFIDADITFQPQQVERMVDFDKDLVAGLYPAKKILWNKIAAKMEQGEPIDQAGLMYTAENCTGSELKTESGFATARYAATGFMLIKRSVFERMVAAYPETKFKYLHDPIVTQKQSDNFYALYECMVDPATGRYLSEDYSFCRRWRDIGGEIWIDLESKLTHVGPFEFHGDSTLRYAPLANISQRG